MWLFRDKKCDKCDAAFSKIEYLKFHKENAHSNIEFNCEATPEISEGIFLNKIFAKIFTLKFSFLGAGKICKNCGEHYLKRHAICLAVLSKTPPKRKSEAEETDYDNMMNEFYLNCPFKMKKTSIR